MFLFKRYYEKYPYIRGHRCPVCKYTAIKILAGHYNVCGQWEKPRLRCNFCGSLSPELTIENPLSITWRNESE